MVAAGARAAQTPAGDGADTAPSGHASGAPMLRERGELTRLMILRVLARGPAPTQRDVAADVGVTVQAVSDHMRRLSDAGHVVVGDEGARITPEGLEHLQSNLRSIKGYVDGALREVGRIDRCGALAGADVKKGDQVGLVMERGRQVAYPGREASSHGVAATDARAGQDVAVEGLEGVLDLRPGRVIVGVLPDAVAGGSRAVDGAALAQAGKTAGLVVAAGPVAEHVAADLASECVAFGGGYAAAEAALRGVDVLLLVEAEQLADQVSRIEEAARVWGIEVAPETRSLARA